MRTFPKALAPFRELVRRRANEIKVLTWQQIVELPKDQTEDVMVGKHRGAISIIVECETERLRVVIQGFLKHRFLPGSSIAMEGFVKERNDNVIPMTDDELVDYA